MAKITISTEAKRGCGYRKPGKKGYGIYLMADAPSAPCGRMPFPLTVCQCCGAGIKPSRGFTWIRPVELFMDTIDIDCESPICYTCPMNDLGRIGSNAGLIWIGEKFYKTAEHFRVEAQRMGISRKLPALPTDFKIGRTWVFFAHRKCIPYKDTDGELQWHPGVFMAAKPSHIDLVIEDADEVPKYAEKLQDDLGSDKIRIVKVIRDVDAKKGADLGQ